MSENANKNNEYHYSYHFDSGSGGNGGGVQKDGSYHYRYESTKSSSSTSMTPKKKNGNGGSIPWWVIVLCFVMGLWPVGVILIIIRASQEDGSSGKSTEYARRAAKEVRSVADEVRRGVKSGQSAYATGQDAVTATKSKSGKTAAVNTGGSRNSNVAAGRLKRLKSGSWMSIVGAILAICCGIATASAVADGIGYLSYEPMWLLEDALVPFIFTGIGAGLFTCGRLKKRKNRRFRRYINLIADQRQVSISTLAAALPAEPDKVTATLQDMIDDGIFGDQAYIDYSRGLLVLDGSGVKERAKPEPAPEALSEDAALLRQIRTVNDHIAHPEMSRKIDRIEEITGRILEFQKEHPEKAAELRKFLNYYLPTTLKILNSYAELEKQGITGENIDATKERIEGMMDMVVEGFERQLDKLFAGDMMDIAADITVMEQMMEGDGLFEKDDEMQMGGH